MVRTAAVASTLIRGLQRIVNLALTLAILGSLLLFALQYIHVAAVQDAWPVVRLHHFADPIVSRLVPLLHLQRLKAYAALILAGLVVVVAWLCDRLFLALQMSLELSRLRSARRSRAVAIVPESVESEKTREHLYKEYRKIEKQLKEAKRRRCTFLSVDVVGSTGMKNGETEIAITSTFRAYEDLLKRTFKATRAWKESWTPDGVMICFLNREDAVAAAQAILQRLLVFNEHENALKTRFEVRCGINEGEVVVFEDSDLEKLVEHVIDVAGHMQKHANPGTLWLSKELYETLENSAGFQPTAQEVDGYATYQWTPAG